MGRPDVEPYLRMMRFDGSSVELDRRATWRMLWNGSGLGAAFAILATAVGASDFGLLGLIPAACGALALLRLLDVRPRYFWLGVFGGVSIGVGIAVLYAAISDSRSWAVPIVCIVCPSVAYLLGTLPGSARPTTRDDDVSATPRPASRPKAR